MEGLRRPLELSPGCCAFVALINLDGNFLVFALPNTSRILKATVKQFCVDLGCFQQLK